MSAFSLFQKALADRLDPTARKPLAEYAETLRRDLRQMDAAALAERSEAELRQEEGGVALILPFWGEPAQAHFPELVFCSPASRAFDDLSQALLLHHLHHSDGAALAGSWMAFSELPDGRFYAQAFQGYTGQPLAQRFGEAGGAFAEAALAAGGASVPFAARAFAFRPLPRAPLLVACWEGDEDFPTSYRILFDASAPHHFSTDACAILGSMLVRRLLRVVDKETSRQVDK